VVELCDPLAAAVIGALGRPRLPSDIAAAVPELPQVTTSGLLDLLWAAGMLDRHASGDATPGEQTRELEHWGFTDLLFHRRSRWGAHVLPTGGTFPLRGRSPAFPVVKPPMDGEIVDLPRPDVDGFASTDRPFAQVLEQRRSIRTYGDEPLSIAQLGDFLYRVGRVRRIEDGEHLPYAISSRPYPSGGACYPLELYPVVSRCAGLPRGVYHYEPVGHHLTRVAQWNDSVAALVADARLGEGHGPVQVLLVVTARFRRTMWKYQGMAYATILKDVGVLYQTMYLVATAMELGPCALGCGNTEMFSNVVGLDPYEEGSVGEFLLGSCSPEV
jgi:SagB-type dehydrogenase family enzyme